MKKVLYIHHGSSQGGAPRSLSFLLRRIPTNKYLPEVAIISDYEDNSKLFEQFVRKIYRVKGIYFFHGSTVCDIRSPLYVIKQFLKIPFTIVNTMRLLKESKPDIVHLNSTCLWVAAMAVKMYDKKIKVICHIREPLANSLCGHVISSMCHRFVDGFIAIDRYDSMSINTGNKPVKVVYNFVDFSIYNPDNKSDVLRKESSLNSERVILLYLARIAESNGAFEMVKYFAENFELLDNADLFVIGFDNENDSYDQKVIDAAEGYERIHLMPFRRDVVDVIASSDIMIVPFQTPHFARSVIEAAAMGIPSIASKIPGPEELIIDGETGYLFNYENFSDFGDKCLNLIQNRSIREEMGKKAVEFAKKNFDAENNSRETYKFYEEV